MVVNEQKKTVDALIRAAMTWTELRYVSVEVSNTVDAHFLSRLCELPQHLEIDAEFSNPYILPPDLPTIQNLRIQSFADPTAVDFDFYDQEILDDAPLEQWIEKCSGAMLSGVTTLEFYEMGGTELCVGNILASGAPHLAQLRVLDLQMCAHTEGGGKELEEMARAGSVLRELRDLRITNTSYGTGKPGAIAPLVRAMRSCEMLERLWIHGGAVLGVDDCRAIVDVAASFPRLRSFMFIGYSFDFSSDVARDIAVDIMEAVVEHWPLLRELRLVIPPMDARVGRVLGSARFAHLESLTLKDNKGLGSQGVSALLDGGAPWLNTVTYLNVSDTWEDADSVGVVHAFERAAILHLKSLARLGVNEDVLERGMMEDAGVELFYENDEWSDLPNVVMELQL